MERQSVFCSECVDYMEVEHRKGRWLCENCGKDLTKETEKKIKRENEFNKKHRRQRWKN